MSKDPIDNSSRHHLVDETLSPEARELELLSIHEHGQLNSYIEQCAASFYEQNPTDIKELLGDEEEIDQIFYNFFSHHDRNTFQDDSNKTEAERSELNKHEINSIEYTEMNTIIGDTVQHQDTVQQQYDDTCAIKSQQLILNEFGIPVTEDQLVEWSIEQGLYSGNGTLPADVGKIIAAADIPCTQKSDANIFDLTNELAQGHKVIIGVDSGELWNSGLTEWWNDFYSGDTPDHALIVAGIDNSDPNNPQVLLTDPGTGESNKSYPLDQFMDAWKDSGCFMVSTDVAPAEFASTQIMNNQPSMYLPEIAGQSYQDFQIYHNIAESFPSFYSWDYASNPSYPTASLYDYYALDTPISELAYSPFAQFVNSSNFLNHYNDTMDFGIKNLVDTQALTNLESFVSSPQFVDNIALNNFFEAQMQDCLISGDTDSAQFFSQQMDFMKYCQSVGIDPTGFYQTYDFTGLV